jgi:hypothetical protein
MFSKVQSTVISAYADIKINTTQPILSTRNLLDGLPNNFGLVSNRMEGQVGALQPKQIGDVRIVFALFCGRVNLDRGGREIRGAV